jgi:hypothetical protein
VECRRYSIFRERSTNNILAPLRYAPTQRPSSSTASSASYQYCLFFEGLGGQHTYTQTHRHTDTHTHIHTDTHTQRHTYTDTQKDRQTDKQSNQFLPSFQPRQQSLLVWLYTYRIYYTSINFNFISSSTQFLYHSSTDNFTTNCTKTKSHKSKLLSTNSTIQNFSSCNLIILRS